MAKPSPASTLRSALDIAPPVRSEVRKFRIRVISAMFDRSAE
jgi:hypothetical protein